MNQTTTTTTTTTNLQLEEDGKAYLNSEEARERLLHTLQTNDCQGIIAAIVDGDDLANVFAAAAYRDHVDVLEAFLHHEMNVDMKNKNGCTALMNASFFNQKASVRFLLDRNAKVDLQNIAGGTALMIASQLGNAKIAEMLLAKNANPNLRDDDAMTALMWASAYGKKEVVQLLLNHNPDIDLKSKDGKTALDLAANEKEIKEMIRNHVSSSYLLQ